MPRWEIIQCIDKIGGNSYKRKNLETGEIQDFEMNDKMAKWLLEVEKLQDASEEYRAQRAFEDDMYKRSSSS